MVDADLIYHGQITNTYRIQIDIARAKKLCWFNML